MAARNGSKWISEQIASILAQRNVRIDLTISDDHSSDGTRDEINHFIGDARVKMLSPPASTGSAAQNFLWLIRRTSLSDHEYVALADQDDIWDPEKIHRGLVMLRASQAAGYSCAVTAIWPDGRRRTLRQNAKATCSDFLFEGAGQGCTFILAAQFFRDIRLFFEAEPNCTSQVHYHDWTIYALARVWKRPWHFDHQPMMQYRQHPANDTGARLSFSGVRKRLSLIRGGWYRRQLKEIAGIVAKASPQDGLIAKWNELLSEPSGLSRRLRVSRFCMTGGRRRKSDKTILMIAAMLGWI
jgi:rhamnosyltransferase